MLYLFMSLQLVLNCHKAVAHKSIWNSLGVADHGYDRTTGSNMATFFHFCSCILKKMIQESSWIWQLGKMPQPSWAQPGQLHRGARRDAESVNMHLHRTAKMILISAVCDNLQNIEYALAANRYSTMTFISLGRCHVCDNSQNAPYHWIWICTWNPLWQWSLYLPGHIFWEYLSDF